MRYDLGRFRRPMRRSTEGQLASLIGLGDGSTLSLDFTAMSSLDSRFTFTRASTATYINSSGLVTTMAAASTNDPTKARFDHDPTTLAPRGLLIEGSVTNLVLQSDTLSTPPNWVANAVTRTNVSTVTPDGNTTATTCGLSHTGSGSFRSNTTTVTASTAYTFSFWAKNNGGSVALYRAYNVSGSADIVAETSYFSQINGSTWTRVQFTFTTPVGCTSVYVYPLSQSSGTSNVLIWGAQLEAGSGASSYVASGASQGQRAADVCTMSGTNFSSWFNSTEGTFLATGERAITSNFGRLLSANANNTTSAFDLGASTNGRWLITNTTSQADITAGTVTANTAFKVAGAFANNDAQIAFNGTLGTADTSVSLPTVSQLDIGADRTAVYLNGRIRSIKFWPTRLPNATLQSLTQ